MDSILSFLDGEMLELFTPPDVMKNLDSSSKALYFSRPSQNSIDALKSIIKDAPEADFYHIGKFQPPQMLQMPEGDPKEVPWQLPYTEIDLCSLHESNELMVSSELNPFSNDISEATWKKTIEQDFAPTSDKKEKKAQMKEWKNKIRIENEIVMNKTFQAMNIVEIKGATENHVYDRHGVYECIGTQIERTGFLVSEKHGEYELGADEDRDLEDDEESEESEDDEYQEKKKQQLQKKKKTDEKDSVQDDDDYTNPKGLKMKKKKRTVNPELPLIPEELRNIAEDFLYSSETVDRYADDPDAIEWRSQNLEKKYIIKADDRIKDYKKLLKECGNNRDLAVIKYGNFKIFTNVKRLSDWDTKFKEILNTAFPLKSANGGLGKKKSLGIRKAGPSGTYRWSLNTTVQNFLAHYVTVFYDTVKMMDEEITYEEVDQVSLCIFYFYFQGLRSFSVKDPYPPPANLLQDYILNKTRRTLSMIFQDFSKFEKYVEMQENRIIEFAGTCNRCEEGLKYFNTQDENSEDKVENILCFIRWGVSEFMGKLTTRVALQETFRNMLEKTKISSPSDGDGFFQTMVSKDGLKEFELCFKEFFKDDATYADHPFNMRDILATFQVIEIADVGGKYRNEIKKFKREEAQGILDVKILKLFMKRERAEKAGETENTKRNKDKKKTTPNQESTEKTTKKTTKKTQQEGGGGVDVTTEEDKAMADIARKTQKLHDIKFRSTDRLNMDDAVLCMIVTSKDMWFKGILPGFNQSVKYDMKLFSNVDCKENDLFPRINTDHEETIFDYGHVEYTFDVDFKSPSWKDETIIGSIEYEYKLLFLMYKIYKAMIPQFYASDISEVGRYKNEKQENIMDLFLTRLGKYGWMSAVIVSRVRRQLKEVSKISKNQIETWGKDEKDEKKKLKEKNEKRLAEGKSEIPKKEKGKREKLWDFLKLAQECLIKLIALFDECNCGPRGFPVWTSLFFVEKYSVLLGQYRIDTMADLSMLVANIGELLNAMDTKEEEGQSHLYQPTKFRAMLLPVLKDFLAPNNWNKKFATNSLQKAFGTVPIYRELVNEANLYVSPWYTSKEDNFLQNKRWALQVLANDTYAGKEKYRGKYMLISKEDYKFDQDWAHPYRWAVNGMKDSSMWFMGGFSLSGLSPQNQDRFTERTAAEKINLITKGILATSRVVGLLCLQICDVSCSFSAADTDQNGVSILNVLLPDILNAGVINAGVINEEYEAKIGGVPDILRELNKTHEFCKGRGNNSASIWKIGLGKTKLEWNGEQHPIKIYSEAFDRLDYIMSKVIPLFMNEIKTVLCEKTVVKLCNKIWKPEESWLKLVPNFMKTIRTTTYTLGGNDTNIVEPEHEELVKSIIECLVTMNDIKEEFQQHAR